ncbi:MAG: cobalamin biosynthesis protein [Pseudomonadota bacterium]|nr:cobalamin biosynthesis protein [Pseudomonadota bacterium]MDE3038563.1 cobalamin biosynthesis protein [Pseudomonadota bacterium]
MERAFIVLSALLLNAVSAGPRRIYVGLGLTRLSRWPAQRVRDLERKLNRSHRSLTERETRGMILVGVVFLGSLLAGGLGGLLFQHNLRFVELLIVTILLPVRPTWDIASRIRKCLQAGDMAGARQALEGTAWKHHALLDEYGVARAAIEMLAVHFSEKILAPAVWYLLFGLPGLLLSKAAWLLRETLASDPAFGQAAKAAHVLLHYLPSRLAALLWLSASLFLPSCRASDIIKQVTPALIKTSPPLLALLSAAGALRLSLGGPASVYAGKQWLGSGSARPGATDIRRALTLFALLHLLLFILVGFFL